MEEATHARGRILPAAGRSLMQALLDMAGVAAFRGVHYDTVRKGWQAWVREEGFPAPVTRRPYGWNPDSLAAWAARREADNLAAVMTPATGSGAAANQNEPAPRPAPPALRRVDRQRAAVMGFMTAGG